MKTKIDFQKFRLNNLNRNLLLDFKSTENVFIITMAVVIGIICGLSAVFFHDCIHFIKTVFFGKWGFSLTQLATVPWYWKIAIPALGGLIVGPMIYFLARSAKGHGVPEVMESIALNDGKISLKAGIVKFFASAISIGSGSSVGPEGPVIHFGSVLGSNVGKLLKVTVPRMKVFVACGASGGIAAAFNAPIAGAIFSVELISGNFSLASFLPIVISSAMATVVSHHFEGATPAFAVPEYALISPVELIFYALLGVVAAFVSVAFIKMLHYSEDKYGKLKAIPQWIKPVTGGILLGGLAIFYPHIYGIGYESIHTALNSGYGWQLLLALLTFKLLGTCITLGSGLSGGVFAPSLFLGAMSGGLVGYLANYLMPQHTAGPGAYALVGMGALLTGTMHAPLTAIIIIFELTHDYSIILPLMIAVVITTILAGKMEKESIYTVKLSQRGINLSDGMEINVLKSIKVSSLLISEAGKIMYNLPLAQMLDFILSTHFNNLFVTKKDGTLAGIIALPQLRSITKELDNLGNMVIAADIMNENVLMLTPEDNLDLVFHLFTQTGASELPVVESVNNPVLLGIIRHHDLMDAYNIALTKRDLPDGLLRGLKSVNRVQQAQIFDNLIMKEVYIPNFLLGYTVLEKNIRKAWGVEIILLKRKTEEGVEKFYRADEFLNKPLKTADKLLVLGEKEKIFKFQNA